MICCFRKLDRDGRDIRKEVELVPQDTKAVVSLKWLNGSEALRSSMSCSIGFASWSIGEFERILEYKEELKELKRNFGIVQHALQKFGSQAVSGVIDEIRARMMLIEETLKFSPFVESEWPFRVNPDLRFVFIEPERPLSFAFDFFRALEKTKACIYHSIFEVLVVEGSENYKLRKPVACGDLIVESGYSLSIVTVVDGFWPIYEGVR